MQQDDLLMAPAATESLAAWEQYLNQCLRQKSSCRVKNSRLGESPQSREQQFLKRIVTVARESFQQTALAAVVPVLQKEVLDRIQLRRRLIPDDSPDWNRAEVFLAVTELHRSLNLLLNQIDQYRQQYTLVKDQAALWLEICRKCLHGKLQQTTEIQTFTQQIRSVAADASVEPLSWLGLCRGVAELEAVELGTLQKSALAVSLQTTYLAARLLRKNSWLVDTQEVLTATLFKDMAWLIPAVSSRLLSQGQHATWAAGLISQCPGLSVNVARMIRQHHECLDGSGLPFGVNATEQRRDARLLAVVTRWTELWLRLYEPAAPLQQQDFRVLQESGKFLLAECTQGRWDAEWVALLYENLGLTHPASLPVPYRKSANPHWHAPRPHFLKPQISHAVPTPMSR